MSHARRELSGCRQLLGLTMLFFQKLRAAEILKRQQRPQDLLAGREGE